MKWEDPVDNFDKYSGSLFLSRTEVREDDPDPPPAPDGTPWEPPVIDPLPRYLKQFGHLFPSGMIGEPVNTATGNYTSRNLDLDLKTQLGPKLLFERYFNSQDDYTGPFGRGWTHSFNYQVLAHSDNKFSVKLPDGSGDTFQETDNDPNTFTPTFTNTTPESFATLKRYNDTNGYRFEYTDPAKTTYLFNSDKTARQWGRIEKLTTIDGHSLTFTYNELGNLATIADDFGRSLILSYIPGTRTIASISDSAGRTVSYVYNFDGRLETVTKPNNASWIYTYDEPGRITSITDGKGTTFVTNEYDYQGRVVKQTDGNGQEMSFEYRDFIKWEVPDEGDIGAKRTIITDNRGHRIDHIHNYKNYKIAEIAPNHATTHYKYDDRGNISLTIKPLGQRYSYAYDDRGNIVEETYPPLVHGGEQYWRKYEYNELNLPTKITDPVGTTVNEFNSAGKLIRSVDRTGRETAYTYTSNNSLHTTTDPRSGKTSYSWSSNGFIASEKHDDTTAQLTYEYDIAGNRIKTRDMSGHETVFAYDLLGNVVSITDPKNHVSHFAYDGNGNLSKEVDEAGNETIYATDGNENITKITYPNGSAELFKFDENNNKVQSTDRNGNTQHFTYDENNRLTHVIWKDKEGIEITSQRYEYDHNDNRTAITDGRNNTTRYEYNDRDLLAHVTTPLATSKTYSYDLAGRLTEESDYQSNVWKYEYDAMGRKILAIDPLKHATRYEYDANGNKVQEIDHINRRTIFTYDKDNRLVQVQNPRGDSANYKYNVTGNLIESKNFAGEITTFTYDANGNTTTYVYDTMGWQTRQVDALGGETLSTYDKQGNLLTFTGEDKASISYTYDALNRAILEKNQIGKETKYEYDRNGNLVKLTDKNSHVTEFSYDKLDRLVQVKLPDGSEQKTVYSPNGWVEKETDGDGGVHEYTYDSAGRLTAVRNPRDHTKIYAYNEVNELIEESDFHGRKTQYEYDANGNVVKVTNRKGVTTELSYDGESRITRVKKPYEITTSKLYDKAGRVWKEIDAVKGETTYRYDKASNVSAITDPRNFTTSYTYDKLNRRTATSYPDTSTTQVVYDPVGRVTTSLDENNNKTTFVYDPRGSIVEQINARGHRQKYEYDSMGNMVKHTDARNKATRFEYDTRNRLIKTRHPDGGEEQITYNARSLATGTRDARGNWEYYTYDTAGNITGYKDRSGKTATYEYDNNGNLITHTDRTGAVTRQEYNDNDMLVKQIDAHEKVREYMRDDLDRVVTEVDERGSTTKYTYDSLSRVTVSTDAFDSSMKFSYDPNNNLIQRIDTLNRKTMYTYDTKNRLITVTDPQQATKTYGYDGAGNTTAITDEENNTKTFSYDPLHNLTRATNHLGNETTYQYDPNSNLVAATNSRNHTTWYSYDARNRRVTETLPGGNVYTLTYDKNGNITKETTPKDHATVHEYSTRDLLIKTIDPHKHEHKFSYDDEERLIEEINTKGKKSRYKYDKLGRLTAVTNPANDTTHYEYNETGSIIKEIDVNGHANTYTYDTLGRITTETNAEGSTWKYSYDPAGNLIEKLTPSQEKIRYEYDVMDRRIAFIYPEATHNVTNRYDKVGNLLATTRGDLTNTYSYDKNYRLTADQDSRGRSTGYTYDSAGNRTQVTYPDGSVARYVYSKNEQVAELIIEEQRGQEVGMYKTSFSYDQNLNLVKQSNPNNSHLERTYDELDRLIQNVNRYSPENFSGFSVSSTQEFALDELGNITKENNTFTANCEVLPGSTAKQECKKKLDGATIEKKYSYDELARVKAVTEKLRGKTVLSESFGYDKAGNRTYAQSESNGRKRRVNYVYDKADRLTSDSESRYTYSPNGYLLERKTKDGKEFVNSTYTADGLVTGVTSTFKDSKQEYNMTYRYDGLGRRAIKLNLNAKETEYPGMSGDKRQDITPDIYEGIARVDYYYDSLSWDDLAVYYDRIGRVEADEAAAEEDQSPASEEPFELPLNESLRERLERQQREGKKNRFTTPRTNPGQSGKVEVPDLSTHYYRIPEHAQTRIIASSDRVLPEDTLTPHTHSSPSIPSSSLSYHHPDALGSTIARTRSISEDHPLEISDDPTITLASLGIGEVYQFSAYGKDTTHTYLEHALPPDQAHKLTQNTLPTPHDFSPFNSRTYSGKEYDPESRSYSYGSRNYNPDTAQWNRSDDYRGTLTEPISRHRYQFVGGNPVNRVDLYGFSDDPLTRAHDRVEGDFNQAGKDLETQKNNIAHYQSELNRVTNALPGLYAQMIQAKWAAYHAKIEYYDFVVVDGVINRLEAKGYELNYREVKQYTGQKVVEKRINYGFKQQQYVRSQGSYYGAVAYKGNLQTQIQQTSHNIAELKKAFEFYGEKMEFVDDVVSLAEHDPRAAGVEIGERIEYDDYLNNVFNESWNSFYEDNGNFDLSDTSRVLGYGEYAVGLGLDKYEYYLDNKVSNGKQELNYTLKRGVEEELGIPYDHILHVYPDGTAYLEEPYTHEDCLEDIRNGYGCMASNDESGDNAVLANAGGTEEFKLKSDSKYADEVRMRVRNGKVQLIIGDEVIDVRHQATPLKHQVAMAQQAMEDYVTLHESGKPKSEIEIRFNKGGHDPIGKKLTNTKNNQFRPDVGYYKKGTDKSIFRPVEVEPQSKSNIRFQDKDIRNYRGRFYHKTVYNDNPKTPYYDKMKIEKIPSLNSRTNYPNLFKGKGNGTKQPGKNGAKGPIRKGGGAVRPPVKVPIKIP